MYYNEIADGKTKGVYVMTIQGARFYGAYYLSEKEGEKVELKLVDDDL